MLGRFYASRNDNSQLFLGFKSKNKSKDVEYNKCVLSDETRAVTSRLVVLRHTTWKKQELIFLEVIM